MKKSIRKKPVTRAGILVLALALAREGNLWAAEAETQPAATNAPAAAEAPKVYAPDDQQGLRGQLRSSVTLEGVVARIGESKSGTVLYVNFSDKPHVAATVVLFVDATTKDEAKKALEALVGKKVRVSGVIEEYRTDLQIKIKKPDDLVTI